MQPPLTDNDQVRLSDSTRSSTLLQALRSWGDSISSVHSDVVLARSLTEEGGSTSTADYLPTMSEVTELRPMTLDGRQCTAREPDLGVQTDIVLMLVEREAGRW